MPDMEKYRIHNLVLSLYHNALREHIAHANEREVIDNLYNFYTHSDIAIISKYQLRQYQELEKLSLDKSMFEVNNKNG